MSYLKNNYHRFEDVDAGTIRADVIIDSSGATKGAKEVDSALKRVESSVKSMNNSLGKSTSGFKNIQRSLGATKTAINKQIKEIKAQLTDLSKSQYASPSLSTKLEKMDAEDALKSKYATSSPTTEKEVLSLNTKLYKLKQMLNVETAAQEKRATQAGAAEERAAQKALAASEKKIALEQQIAAVQSQRTSFMTDFTDVDNPEITAALREKVNALLQSISAEQREAVVSKLMAESNKNVVNSTISVIKELKGEAQASAQVKTPIDKLRSSMNALDKVNGQVANSFRNFVMKLQSFAVTYRIISGFFGRLIRGMYDMFQSAASYEEALNLYTVALGDYAEDATKWANRISEALYLDPKNIMQYTGALYNLTKGLGVTSDAAYLMSTNLTQLAYDMSSYLNIDVQSAYDKIQSAIVGQSRAVASAGIAMQLASLQEMVDSIDFGKVKVDLSDVALQQLLLSKNIKINVKDLGQAGKTYLRYIQIMRSTTKMQGDLGRTIVTPENALRVIRQQFEMLGRAIGQVFIPIIMTAIPYIMVLTQALKSLANWLAKLTGYKVADIDYSKTNADVEKLNKKLKETEGNANGAGSSIQRMLAPFDELNVVESESKSSGSGGSDTDYAKIFEPLLEGYDMLQYLTDEFNDKLENAKKNLKLIAPLVAGIGVLFGTWVVGVGAAKAIILVSDLAAAIGSLTGSEVTIGAIGSAIAGLGPIALVVVAVIGQIAYAIYNVLDGFNKIKSDDTMDKVVGWFEIIGGVLTIFTGGLGIAILGIANWIKMMDWLIDKFKETDKESNTVFGKIKKNFEKVYNFIKDKVTTAKNEIDKFHNWLMDSIINPVSDALKPIFDLIERRVNISLQIIKDLANFVGSIIEHIVKPLYEGVKEFFEFLGHWISVAYDNIKDTVKFIWEIIDKLVTMITDLVKWCIDKIKEYTKPIATWISEHAIKPISKAISSLFTPVMNFGEKLYNDYLKPALDKCKKFVTELIDVFADLGKKMGGAIKGALTGVINEFIREIESALNLIGDAVNFLGKMIKKITGKDYGSVGKIKLSRLDTGGFVDDQLRSADVFAMNENGRAEYLTSIGNRTAVVNQDQMVAALSNVLISALSSVPVLNQQGTTVVNIGNKKVYEGQGTYQNRQADRYGISYVKV